MDNQVAKGGYILNNISLNRDLTLIATGSEVEIAMEASELLNNQGFKVAVVTLPCWELFDQQDESYKIKILGDCPRIAIEAGCDMGWAKYIGDKGAFIGMNGFGASGPASELYKHFGITTEAVVEKAIAILN